MSNHVHVFAYACMYSMRSVLCFAFYLPGICDLILAIPADWLIILPCLFVCLCFTLCSHNYSAETVMD